MNEVKPTITFEDFSKVDIRIGTVVEAYEVPGSNKLLELSVDFGGTERRRILAGIRKSYLPGDLLGRQMTFVVNLEPRRIAGLESEGMIIVGHGEEGVFSVLSPDKPLSNGSFVG